MTESSAQRLAWADERVAYCQEQLEDALWGIPGQGESSRATDVHLWRLRREREDALGWQAQVEAAIQTEHVKASLIGAQLPASAQRFPVSAR
jgi:DNA-binding response OmpR family regulator